MDALNDGIVTLRRFRDGDVVRIVEACSDTDIARFIPGMPVPYTESDARSYVTFAEKAWSGGDRRPFAIVDTKTGALVGAIEVRVGEVGSIGY